MKLHQPRTPRDELPAGPRTEPAEADIQKAAYYLWQSKGCPSGSDLDIWLEARELLRHQVHADTHHGPRSKAPTVTQPVVHFPTPHSEPPFPPAGPQAASSHLDFRHAATTSLPSNPPLRKP